MFRIVKISCQYIFQKDREQSIRDRDRKQCSLENKKGIRKRRKGIFFLEEIKVKDREEINIGKWQFLKLEGEI